MKKILLIASYSFFLAFPFSFADAAIVNGDFSTGNLTGWRTEDFNINTFNFSSPSASVSVSNERAVLSTQGFSSDIGIITLFQDLLISPLATSISFDVGFSQSFDNTGSGQGFPDFFQASYFDFNDSNFDRFFLGIDSSGAFDPNTFNPIVLTDLGNGLFRFTQSIADIAGRNGTLFFDLFDDDDGFVSTATLDNVVINEATVPEPSILFLFLIGLMTLFIKNRYLT